MTGLAHNCGEAESQRKLRNNTVHSVYDSSSEHGQGAIVVADLTENS